MFGGLSENYEKLWRGIIRPPRAEYTVEDLGNCVVIEGPKVFKRHGMKVERTDVQLTNKRGFKIYGSHFQPLIRPSKQLPCVIYLHGNSSCRLEAMTILPYVLCHDVSLFAFDFSGCGLSEGEYISLGFYQREDVDCVFTYLRSLETVSSIAIWGRSMGAVTALMYADQNHEIACLVLDSPFSNLQKLCKELADKYAGNLSMFSGIALSFVKSTIKEKNNFELENIDPIGKHVKKAYIPAFFIHGQQDDFIIPQHTKDLYEAYSGEKKIQIVNGDHNSQRDEEVNEKISNFLYFGLCVKDLVVPDKAFIEQQKIQKQGKVQNFKSKSQKHKNYQAYSENNQDFDSISQEEEQLNMAIQMSLAFEKEKEKDKSENAKEEEKQKK